jgi:hypothetical protein
MRLSGFERFSEPFSDLFDAFGPFPTSPNQDGSSYSAGKSTGNKNSSGPWGPFKSSMNIVLMRVCYADFSSYRFMPHIVPQRKAWSQTCFQKTLYIVRSIYLEDGVPVVKEADPKCHADRECLSVEIRVGTII